MCIKTAGHIQDNGSMEESKVMEKLKIQKSQRGIKFIFIKTIFMKAAGKKTNKMVLVKS